MSMSPAAATTDTGKKLRIAFIGSGGISHAHTKALNTIEEAEIVAIADPSEKSTSRYCEAFSLPDTAVFTDYEEMLKQVQPDAVSICTPNFLHGPASIAAMQAGADVIVEKPMAMTGDEAQEMLNVSRKLKRKLVIAFQWRFEAKTQFLRAATDAGRFGNILYGRTQALRRRGIPNWGVFGQKKLQGGGPMIDIGVHLIEATHYVMGTPKPVAATGACFTYLGDKPSETTSMWPDWDYKTYDVEDLAVGQIRFDNGAILSVEASFAAHIENGVHSFEVMGEKAGCKFEPVGIFEDRDGYMVNSKPDFLPKVNVFQVKMRDFVEHVLYDKPTRNPAEHGVMVQKMLQGIYDSAEQRCEVPITMD